ncbi:DUF1059 domain-containing protein [Marinicellulosiphila megalodicopiae]|uniref:DUF1059 domain-containing protein n=1 Tax=Marinicellulosiphila megalodicopiae TaxID=2724896 RepID=UPI003BAE2DBE
MKTMTCKQLGGACDLEISANTFEEMANLSRAHGMEMFQKSDEAHLTAMNDMKHLMTDPIAMQKWMDERKADFEAAPDV